MFKEQGYEAFLAEKLSKADNDIKLGRVLTLEKSRQKTMALLERKAHELEEIEQHKYA